MLACITLSLFIGLAACGHKPHPLENNVPHEFFEASYSMHSLPVAESLFNGGENRGVLSNTAIHEASGLAVSRLNHSFLYTHNDRGDVARLFLLDHFAQQKLQINLQGAENRDWEDICIGPGPIPFTNYLYIGDIGDNQARWEIKTIYRLPEPDFIPWVESELNTVNVSNFETIRFVYPDGKKDAETLMIDPLTRDLYIVSKREFPVTVYRLPYPQSTSSVITAEKFCTLPFQWAVAGDISAEGSHIVIKTYFENFLWLRGPNESVADAFKRPPVRIPLEDEPQGESFAWCHFTGAYYTLSEKGNEPTMPPLFKYTPKQ
ncbi:MAG: hypothetical protein ACXITV_05965 [Luteibaculaceae bacterium]